MTTETIKEKIRVLVVDDHPAICEALTFALSRTQVMEVCDQASNIIDALRKVESLGPQVVVVDLSLGNENGLDLLERLRDRFPKIKVIVWTAHCETHFAERALRAGASGYVTKDQPSSVVINAIASAIKGQIYLNESLAQNLLHRVAARGAQQAMIDPESLSNRELEVFLLIGQGRKTRDIANIMHVSMNTVQTYRERIRRKFQLGDCNDVIHFATTWLVEQKTS
jgi:DNA-binding NarL/FixJ family response regulator